MVQTLSDGKVACGKMSMQSQFRRKVVLRKAKSQLGETLAAVCSVKPQEDKDAQSCAQLGSPRNHQELILTASQDIIRGCPQPQSQEHTAQQPALSRNWP